MFVAFRGHESTAAAVAAYMRDHGLTPEDVLAAHDAWLAERMAESGKTERSVRSGEWSEGKKLHSQHSKLHSQKNSTLKKRRKAGDFAQLPDACPACGGAVEMYQLCPVSSPIWRTQLACMADGCAWHGKSKLPIDALIAAGAKNIKNNVMEG